MNEKKQAKGLALMFPEKRREIATKGGKAISTNAAHMSEIGKKGALARWGAPTKRG